MGGESGGGVKRLLAGGKMESLGLIKKNSGRKRDCLNHGLTPLCFVRESALCCCRLSLNRQTQLIIVEAAQKAGKGGGRGCIVSRRQGRVCVCARMCVCFWASSIETNPAKAAWQDG